MPTTPFLAYSGTVEPSWIDYNDHMNAAYYVLAFDRASDHLFDHVGIGEAYRRATQCSVFAVEGHVTYQRELKAGDPIVVRTQLIGADPRRLHIFHRMVHAQEDYLAATFEVVALHVDLKGPRAAPMPAAALARVEAMLAEHRHLPRPPQLGRRVDLKRHR